MRKDKFCMIVEKPSLSCYTILQKNEFLKTIFTNISQYVNLSYVYLNMLIKLKAKKRIIKLFSKLPDLKL